MSSPRPYYRKRAPGPFHVINRSDGSLVDLRHVRLPTYGSGYTVEAAAHLFDARTAEFVRANVGDMSQIVVLPIVGPVDTGVHVLDESSVPHGTPFVPTPAPIPVPASQKIRALLETDSYNIGDVNVPTTLCLAVLAYLEYFPYDRSAARLKDLVSEAVLDASSGWCGTLGSPPEAAGAGAIGTFSSLGFFGGSSIIGASSAGEGNYDISQMHLLQMAYRYYDALRPEAADRLIAVLLATGHIDRPGIDQRVTSGSVPQDWGLAGEITALNQTYRIGETENHILSIHTARYLTNQLLYQRDRSDAAHDNRRNGIDGGPSCTELMLDLLRNFLVDDFSEYNAKPYQTVTRNALRNLCSYAYDHEVRLAARMVLDYISAHVAVSSCDLRRLVPFRRRSEDPYTHVVDGHLAIGLLEWRSGADPSAENFAVLTGCVRAYESNPSAGPLPDWRNDVFRTQPWSIQGDGTDGMMEGLGEYRVSPVVHGLFVDDLQRRFYQRLHRIATDDVRTGQNANNYEIYAGSPSYLISAGGSTSGHAIDPGPEAIFSPDKERLQDGFAMTTSFMPTGQSAGPNTQNYASDLIQFGNYAEFIGRHGVFENYGVAPDLAFGHAIYLPQWCLDAVAHSNDPSNPAFAYSKDRSNDFGTFSFVDKKQRESSDTDADGPGFFLAIYKDSENGFAVMEAFDTWLSPNLNFQAFVESVWSKNAGLNLRTHVTEQLIAWQYVTTNGNANDFVIWSDDSIDLRTFGAYITSIKYGDDPLYGNDRIGDASKTPDGLLNGTVLNSLEDALITIDNPIAQQRIVLDMRDRWHPKRTSETGEVEVAGYNAEVWVDFDYSGPQEGDFFHPFNTLAAAIEAVADPGTIKILPGATRETRIPSGKRIRLEAASGNVTFGV